MNKFYNMDFLAIHQDIYLPSASASQKIKFHNQANQNVSHQQVDSSQKLSLQSRRLYEQIFGSGKYDHDNLFINWINNKQWKSNLLVSKTILPSIKVPHYNGQTVTAKYYDSKLYSQLESFNYFLVFHASQITYTNDNSQQKTKTFVVIPITKNSNEQKQLMQAYIGI